MYIKAMIQVSQRGCTHFKFDLLQGGLDRITSSTPLFSAMIAVGLHKIIYTTRKKSYQAEISPNVHEQFEQIRLNLRIMIPSLKVFRGVLRVVSLFDRRADRYLSYFDYLGPKIERKNKDADGKEMRVGDAVHPASKKRSMFPVVVLGALALGFGLAYWSRK